MELLPPASPGSEPQHSLADIKLSPPSCEKAPTEEIYDVVQTFHREILKAAIGKMVDGNQLRKADIETRWLLSPGNIQQRLAEGAPAIGTDQLVAWVKREVPLKTSPPTRGNLRRNDFAVTLSRGGIYDDFTAHIQQGQLLLCAGKKEWERPRLSGQDISSGAELIQDFLYSSATTSIIRKGIKRRVSFFDADRRLEIRAELDHTRDRRDGNNPPQYARSLSFTPRRDAPRPQTRLNINIGFPWSDIISYSNSNIHGELCDTAQLNSQWEGPTKCVKEVDRNTLTSSRLHLIRAYGQSVLAQIDRLPSRPR